MRRLFLFFFLLNAVFCFGQPERLTGYNLDHFTIREKKIITHLNGVSVAGQQDHPDFGLFPLDGPPCADCMEDLNKRDAYSRYFLAGGNSFFIEKSSSPINYADGQGRWCEINYRLGKVSDQVFAAVHQPDPVIIDVREKTITLGGKIQARFSFPVLNSEPGNVSDFTAGDDGMMFRNYYAGTDLVFIVKEGRIESLFVLRNRSHFASDVVLNQRFISPALKPYSASANPEHQDIFLLDETGLTAFTVDRGFAFDNNKFSASQKLLSRTIGDRLDFMIPAAWLNDPATQYPVVIDPVIWAQNSLPVVSIAGTQFSNVCWTNSCDYFLSVGTPANTTITNIWHSFEFYATGACFAEDGGYSLDYAGCHSPAAAPGVYTNPVHLSNAYYTADTVLVPEFNACLPPPSCASQLLNFTLHFYRCNNDTSTVCSSNCVRATKPWIMYLEGETVSLASISGGTNICEDDTAMLVAVPQYGVPVYSYTWSPSGGSSDTAYVNPSATTVYTVTVTDACANTATLTTTVTVNSNTNPGFTVSPNPACVNDPVQINGNPGGAATDYDWIVAGSNAPGGVISDTQNPSVSYSLPGTYDIILAFSNGACIFNDTIQVTITAANVASVTMNTNPAGSVCAGDTVTFSAVPVNGGPAPNYEWLIDGLSVQNGASDILVSNAFANGSLVQVVMTSNAACTSPATDTASVFMSIGTGASPQVTITPDTAVCDGSALTLTATFTNGGAAPFIQWYANGVPVPGANTSVYSFNVISPDTVISVEVTSSLTCAVNPVGTDSAIINILNNPVAGIALFPTPAGTVCQGDTVVYTALSTNGGVPTWQWYVNGVSNAVTDSVFAFVPNDNDSISVSMMSSLTCIVNPQVDSYTIADVASGASPVVTVTASPSANICTGDTVTFNASLVNGGGSPAFSWTINNIPAGTNDSTLTVSNLNDNDVVQIIATSSLTCATINSDTASVTVTVAGNNPPAVTVAANPFGVCANDTVELIAHGINGGATPVFQWYVNGVPGAVNNDTIYLTNFNQGDSVTVTMTSSLSCVAAGGVSSSPYFSTQLPYSTPSVILSSNPPDSLCIGQEMQITSNISNGGSSPLIHWYVNGLPDSTTTSFYNSTNFGNGDVIYAVLESNQECLTQASDTSNIIRILYRAPLTIQLSADSVSCPGSPVNLTAAVAGGTNGPYDIRWSSGQTDTTHVTVSPLAGESIFVLVSDHCSALIAGDTLVVPTLPAPVADFTYANASPGSFQNTIQFTNLSANADTWLWYFPDSGSTTTDLNPVHQFPSEGIYSVILYTQNSLGCTDSIVYTVIVDEQVAIYYPNSFTPNGDGLNEFFSPIGESLDHYEMTIWNRWGELIYTGDEKKPWNGRMDGDKSPAPEAVYVYRVDYKNDRFGDRIITGRVTLVR